ncbi:MAG: 4Fe-4S dicluster domain-containing protein [Syntrophobacteraceae bacterium]|nr:4Fe-4S dicluster domain-containing protein [Desulfobacteraceae bacterium]
MPLMLPTILKNLFGGPATRLYPIEVREPFEKARGHISFDDEKCALCSVCALKCPAAAIEISKEKGELTFHPARCIVCEVCVEACTTSAIALDYKWRTPFYQKPMEVHLAKARKKPKADKEKAAPAAKT